MVTRAENGETRLAAEQTLLPRCAQRRELGAVFRITKRNGRLLRLVPSFIEQTHEVLSRLNVAEVRYLLVGGLAVSAHGHIRATNDIDLVVALDSDNALKAVRVLTALGYSPMAPVPVEHFADSQRRQRWIEDEGMTVFALKKGSPLDVPVDLFVAEPFDFNSVYVRADLAELLPGLSIPVVPLDILLQMKKAAGRPKDQEDIRVLKELHPG